MTEDSRNFFTGALIATGGLMVALCGTCTAAFAGPALWALATHKNDYMAPVVIMFAAVLGGIPTLIGALVLRSGLKRHRAGVTPPST